MFFARATASQLRIVLQLLNDFTIASSLKMNVDKSRAVVSKVLPRSKREILASISQIPFTSSLGRYLGFSLVQGRVRRADFGDLVERIRRKLGSWKGRLLNKAGRTTLAKAVLTSIPISCTQAMWFPQSACEEIDRIVRNFILVRTDNTRGLNLVNWNVVTRCRHDGGPMNSPMQASQYCSFRQAGLGVVF